MVYTWDIPGIYRLSEYTWYIHGIYRLYTSSGFQMFQKPIENVALNSGRPHRFGLAFQLQFSTQSPSI
jgi:hypothetical protein